MHKCARCLKSVQTHIVVDEAAAKVVHACQQKKGTGTLWSKKTCLGWNRTHLHSFPPDTTQQCVEVSFFIVGGAVQTAWLTLALADPLLATHPLQRTAWRRLARIDLPMPANGTGNA